jgi:hypothetical protein
MAAITDTHRSATARAVGSVSLRSFSIEEITDHMQSNHILMKTVVQRLIVRLRESTSRLNTIDLVSKQLLSEGSENRESIEILMECCENLQKMVGCLGRRMEQKDMQIQGLRRQLDWSRSAINEWTINSASIDELPESLSKGDISEANCANPYNLKQRLEQMHILGQA